MYIGLAYVMGHSLGNRHSLTILQSCALLPDEPWSILARRLAGLDKPLPLTCRRYNVSWI